MAVAMIALELAVDDKQGRSGRLPVLICASQHHADVAGKCSLPNPTIFLVQKAISIVACSKAADRRCVQGLGVLQRRPQLKSDRFSRRQGQMFAIGMNHLFSIR